MAKTGELKEMWDMAAKTNLQFNMVRATLLDWGDILPVMYTMSRHAQIVMKALKPFPGAADHLHRLLHPSHRCGPDVPLCTL